MSLTATYPNLLKIAPEIEYDDIVSALQDLMGNHDSELVKLGKNGIDCCGTGGSGLSKFNTSTAVSFVLNAGGLKVTKFGNRSATSASGSYDFLTELGFPESLESSKLIRLTQSTNLLFLNARQFYSQLQELAAVRKEIGKPTLLNFIGPLLNPCRPTYRLLGVSNAKIEKHLVKTLKFAPYNRRALVVRAASGLDELDPQSSNSITEIGANLCSKSKYIPKDFSLSIATPRKNCQYKVSAQYNAKKFLLVLNGQDKQSDVYQSIVLNAGAGFYVTGRTRSIEDGQELAEKLIADGIVLRCFQKVKGAYNREFSR